MKKKTSSPLRILPGSPMPRGSTLTPTGVNFALFSRHAETVTLTIAPRDKPHSWINIPLDPTIHRTGDVWHALVADAPVDLVYGYRITGPSDPHGEGHAFDASRILLDPYARIIRDSAWGVPRPGIGEHPCCLLDHEPYDWEGDRPLNIPLKDTIIYELHVRGFTRHPSSGVRHPGTYRGVIEQIPYLKELGITAVELLPVTDFDENDGLFNNPHTGEPLKNFWGYSPLSFFAPKGAYSSNPAAPLTEFRDMVKALHRAGIEVILDIVYNHTGEGGLDGPTTSFRGIDNSIYYLLDSQTKAYLNFSGCGNTCNCNHPIVRQLIMDALRWWVVEMHVDGFRFDLASILGRDSTGQVLANPPVVESIAEDPILASTKIIAEAWDAAGLYQVGNFSSNSRWAEWNGRFRDDVRDFLRGEPGMVPVLATRMAGSSDLYHSHDRGPCNSINFITSHDGFTLTDLVSYNHKHNLENGEDNRDGDNANRSWNSGEEGPSEKREVQILRARRIRTMACVLFLSQGVPMLVAGDEFGRTQRGNNNAWCQDNEISWLDWSLTTENRYQLRFFRKLIQLRSAHPVFRRETFFPSAESGRASITWQSLKPGVQDWSDQCHTLAMLIDGDSAEEPDDDFFIMLNGHAQRPARFTVPPPPKKRTWFRIIDTGRAAPNDVVDLKQAPSVSGGQSLNVAPMGCVVLQSQGGGKK
ncbi:MAG: glycogen debranching protein [Desulfobulbus sp.]|jgi:isoamylase